jgi:Ser/Thr protein kinase RdoA (MazF antagonist)
VHDDPEIRAVLHDYGIETARVTQVTVGLINRTYLVEQPSGARAILQYVNPIFSPRVHEDIEAVTAHIEKKRPGFVMPRLIRTKDDRLYTEYSGRIWRLETYLEGVTRERLSSTVEAREGGMLLARFHRAVADLDHEFKNRRLGVHDTKKHLANLRDALEKHRDVHPRYEALRPLLEEVLALADALPALPPTRDRIVHGDPKISNLMFEATSGRGVGIVDLDTLALMPLPLELGDAFRSWCNPLGEDQTTVEFSLELFTAAVDGYARESRGFIDEAEWRSIVPATRTIIVELSARFAADALNESYFGWDPTRFATRGEHNELRARGQVSLARSLARVESDARAVVERAFA